MPAGRASMCSYTSSGTSNCLSGSSPSASLAARTSSSPSGEPCDLEVSTACGAPYAMWLRTMISEGRSSSACAAPIARSSAPTSSDVRHRLDVPAVRLEALALVLGREAERRRAVDRDVVVVVEVDEPAEAEVAGDRRGLHRHALHHVAVGADRVDAPVDDLVVRAVVALGQETVGDREADAVREALSERARRRLDALGDEVLGMARACASPTGGSASAPRARGCSR